MSEAAETTTAKLGAKGVLLLVLLAVAQSFLGPIATSWHAPPIVAEVDAKAFGERSILFLGDSTLMEWDETGDPSTPELLGEALAGYEVHTIAHAAYAAPMYRAIAERILRGETRPNLVIVPVNLRTCSSLWQFNPAYAFAKELLFLGDTPAHFDASFVPLASFKVYDLAPADARAYARITEPLDTAPGEIEKFVLLAEAYYMEELRKDDEYIADLRVLAEACGAKNIPVLFYVTPVDIEAGLDAIGPSMTSRLFANIDTVRTALGPQADLINLVDLLESSNFRTLSTYPEDHPNVAGRRQIANVLAEAAQQRLDARQ